ncbi:MAG: DUF1569 domain-containing protein [Planctomycetota bacterium]
MTARKIHASLKARIRPDKAEFMPQFLQAFPGGYGEGDKVMGVMVPDQRAIAKEYRDLSRSELTKLLRSPWHEVRLTGVYILVDQFQRALAPLSQAGRIGVIGSSRYQCRHVLSRATVQPKRGSTSMASAAKRMLDFHTGEEVIEEIQRLRASGYARTKNWNLTQICEHLTKTMNGGMDGFGFRLPWVLRATVIKWVFQRMLKTRKMSSGPTLKRLRPEWESTSDDDAIIEGCIATLERAKLFDGSLEDYPFLDDLKADDWRQFMWMHAAHHLGFLIPSGESG